jgi:hypothetical protein
MGDVTTYCRPFNVGGQSNARLPMLGCMGKFLGRYLYLTARQLSPTKLNFSRAQ